MILYKMCGCNKNRGIRPQTVHTPQTNPAYKPNAWNRPQGQLTVPVQNQVVSNPVNTVPIQNSIVAINTTPVEQKPVNSITVQNNVNNLNIIPTQNKPSIPIHNPINRRQNIPIKTAVRPQTLPVKAPVQPTPVIPPARTLPVPLRAPYVPSRVPGQVPNVQSKPANVPVRTPYVPVLNKPNIPVSNVQSTLKPVINTPASRNIKPINPAQPASIPKPTNIMQPHPQTLLANRISTANRKR